MTGTAPASTWGSAVMEWTADGGARARDRILFSRAGLAGGGMGRDTPMPCPRRWPCTSAAARRPASTWKQVCFDSPLDELVQTEIQQPALVATSLVMLAALRARGIEPDFVVGHLSASPPLWRLLRAPSPWRRRSPSQRARAGHGRGGARAPRFDGGHPRARRSGGRGALPPHRAGLAGELQLSRPGGRLGRGPVRGRAAPPPRKPARAAP